MFKIEGVDIDTYCWVHPSNISTLPQRWTEQLIEMNLPGTRVAAPDISGRIRMRITFKRKSSIYMDIRIRILVQHSDPYLKSIY